MNMAIWMYFYIVTVIFKNGKANSVDYADLNIVSYFFIYANKLHIKITERNVFNLSGYETAR